MEQNKNLGKIHTVNVKTREKIEVTSVVLVVSSTEKEIYLKLEDGYMSICGTELTILELSPEQEYFVAKGNIQGFRYDSKRAKKSFLGKVFK